MTRALPDVSSPLGAPMGRTSTTPAGTPPAPLKLSLYRIRINAGGYDSGGAYWGQGAPLYRAASDCGTFETWFRARDRDAAKAFVRAQRPTATFYR